VQLLLKNEVKEIQEVKEVQEKRAGAIAGPLLLSHLTKLLV
jgi:hypothetical protein